MSTAPWSSQFLGQSWPELQANCEINFLLEISFWSRKRRVFFFHLPAVGAIAGSAPRAYGQNHDFGHRRMNNCGS